MTASKQASKQASKPASKQASNGPQKRLEMTGISIVTAHVESYFIAHVEEKSIHSDIFVEAHVYHVPKALENRSKKEKKN